MSPSKHLLEVYEPYAFDGSNPIHITGCGLLRGGNGAFYYLVEIDEPLETDSNLLDQLLLLPRYTTDPIKNAQEGACTVNICRVLPGHRLEPNQTFSYNHIEHWGVGKVTLNGH